MPSYQIHRLRSHLRLHFRSAPHVCGGANVKPRDYELGPTIAAPTPYAAFFTLKDTATPLEVGDLLEVDGSLRIFKYVGFEEAQWVVPEFKPENVNADPAGPEAVSRFE